MDTTLTVAAVTLVGLLAACAADPPATFRTLPATVGTLPLPVAPARPAAAAPAIIAEKPVAAESTEWCTRSRRIYEQNSDLDPSIVEVLQSRMKSACAEQAVAPPAMPPTFRQ